MINMSNIADYNYPKSSCNCYQCARKVYPPISNQNPSSLSIADCEIPGVFTCFNNSPISERTIEPVPTTGYTILNPDADSDKVAPEFEEVKCNIEGCPDTQYVSNDPRLISSAHGGQVLSLDRPPRDSSVPLNRTMTDTSLNGFGQNYKTYSDINAGYINYYVDKSIQDPFFLPLFSTSAYSQPTLYKDPMGSFKPQYDRSPLTSTNPIGPTRDHYQGCLSWMEDSTNHREDLLSMQMQKRNEQRWEPRWREAYK
jgi:hypothetical protein